MPCNFIRGNLILAIDHITADSNYLQNLIKQKVLYLAKYKCQILLKQNTSLTAK